MLTFAQLSEIEEWLIPKVRCHSGDITRELSHFPSSLVIHLERVRVERGYSSKKKGDDSVTSVEG